MFCSSASLHELTLIRLCFFYFHCWLDWFLYAFVISRSGRPELAFGTAIRSDSELGDKVMVAVVGSVEDQST